MHYLHVNDKQVWLPTGMTNDSGWYCLLAQREVKPTRKLNTDNEIYERTRSDTHTYTHTLPRKQGYGAEGAEAGGPASLHVC